MPTMVRVKCSVCGKEFDRELKSYNINKKRGQNIYCSKECQMAQQKTGQLVHCAYRNKSIYATKHRIEKSKSGLIFCSHSCNASYFNPITKKRKILALIENELLRHMNTNVPFVVGVEMKGF